MDFYSFNQNTPYNNIKTKKNYIYIDTYTQSIEKENWFIYRINTGSSFINAGVFISSDKNYPCDLQDLLLGEKNCAIKYPLKVPNIYPKIITFPPKPYGSIA